MKCTITLIILTILCPLRLFASGPIDTSQKIFDLPLIYNQRYFHLGWFGENTCSLVDIKMIRLSSKQYWVENCFENEGYLISTPQSAQYPTVKVLDKYVVSFDSNGRVREIKVQPSHAIISVNIQGDELFLNHKNQHKTIKIRKLNNKSHKSELLIRRFISNTDI